LPRRARMFSDLKARLTEEIRVEVQRAGGMMALAA
jgi:hypothetical protein